MTDPCLLKYQALPMILSRNAGYVLVAAELKTSNYANSVARKPSDPERADQFGKTVKLRTQFG